MEGDRISYHESVKKMYEQIKKDGMTNIWDRYEAQGLGNPDTRCSFCYGGVRCDLCSNGPCRADVENNKRGVCGITGDGMAMRMMLLRNVMGTSTYHYHTEATIKTLRATALGKTPFMIKEPEKLKSFAQRLGISTEGATINELALRFADFVQADFNSPHTKESIIVDKLAPADRKQVWRNLGIFPGGVYGEMMFSTSSCLTNVDGYYVSLALKAMRLGIAMAYQSQIVNEFTQDILFGIPRPHKFKVDLGVLDPEYVNVLPNGHEPFLGFAMVQLAKKPEWQEKAKKIGAKGIRIIANIETGQEMIQRWEEDDVFYGFTGNWIMQEAILATGCVDLFACDMNCSMPIDPIYAQKYKFKLIPVSDLVAFEGITDRIDYIPEKAEEQAAKLLELAIANFPERKKTIRPFQGLPTNEAIVGFSTESILAALGGTLDPLLEQIKKGTIRGVVGLVSCTSLRDNGQDVHSIRIAKELIKRDILILSMGCGNGAMQVGGLCKPEAKELAGPGLKAVCEALGIPPVLSYGTCTDTGRIADLIHAVSNALGGVPIPDLPVAAAAPEYMEQKATMDAIFALAFGLYTYVNPVPPIVKAPNLLNLLLKDVKGVTGGIMNVETDAVKAAEGIAAHIESNRKKLGI